MTTITIIPGYCCGCGERTELFLSKHGEPGRFHIRKCRCGSTTGAERQYHQHKRAGFKRPEKRLRRQFKSLRRLKRIEIQL